MQRYILITILILVSSVNSFILNGRKWFWQYPIMKVKWDIPQGMINTTYLGIWANAFAGGSTYPLYGALSSQDCGEGDNPFWPFDNTDGYNAIDHGDECHEIFMPCAGQTLAVAIYLDVVSGNFVKEYDLLMCDISTFGASWNYELHGDSSYVINDEFPYIATVSHEMGHTMGLSHESNAWLNTMSHGVYYGGFNWDSSTVWERAALHNDDVLGIRDTYGACPLSDWSTIDNAGHLVGESVRPNCGIYISIYSGGSSGTWTNPVVKYNNRLGGLLTGPVKIKWEQFDYNHSGIVTINVQTNLGNVYSLHYALNAPGWWGYTSYVDLSTETAGFPPGWWAAVNQQIGGYQNWITIERDVAADFQAEWGGTGETPILFYGVFVQHFVNDAVSGEQGIQIKNLRIER